MHIPSERVYNEMNAESASLWYVPANGGEELAFLIKAPTSCIKALIAGCTLNLVFGKEDAFLCTGVQIMDIPDAPVFISGIQRDLEEHISLIRALTEKKFPLFLFNEMDVCLAWTNVEIAEKNTLDILNFIGSASKQYVGPFTSEASHVLDGFCNAVEGETIYPDAPAICIRKIDTKLESWRINRVYFYGEHEHHTIIIDEKDEGEIFERAIWASLEPVFPLTIYKSPQVNIGKKMRELTDVFSFYPHGSFLIEAKDISLLNAGYHRDQKRRATGVQKQVKKAIGQLIGASKAFARGEVIFDAQGNVLEVDRQKVPHCIILITELMHWGDWKAIEIDLIEAMKQTGAFFHLLDLREFITLLKGSSGKAKLLDYNLIKRCELFIEKKSVFIRCQPQQKDG